MVARQRRKRIARKRKQARGLQGWSTPTLPTSPYPETYAAFPSDMDDWTCEQFAQYYRNLLAVKGVSKTEAWRIFNDDANRISFFAGAMDCCLTSCSFCKSFYKEFGKEFPTTDFLENMACNVATGTESASELPGTILDITKFLLPVAGGIGVWWLGKEVGLWGRKKAA